MAAPKNEVDVVAMPSLRADGKPDQTTGYKVLDDDGHPQAASKYDDPRAATQETPEPDVVITAPRQSGKRTTTESTAP